ncbi:MAG: shikimate dehydrogenase [Leptothrix sp. (in: Bacteria)]|jgi:shikimate dehydrogenase|nr:shikimate dehydrogenase [Leptothrix sp. (in: b-proteobacteria)]HQY09733.1 shikimate dehydrogenase [Burkholderiaceae bacterium]
MDRYAVVGHPVEHSRSPHIHHLFALQTGQDMDYGRLLAPLDGFAATVREFAAAGGRGCNVTMPFKHEAWTLARRHTPRARRAGAANTLRFDAEGWWADNTDGVGLVRDITLHAAVPLAGARLLLVGAGGAAAGVLGPLLEAGVAELLLANRTLARAEALVASHADLARDHGVRLSCVALAELPELRQRVADGGEGGSFDVLVNSSPTSLTAGGPPVPAGLLRPGALALDMVYGPAARPFLAWARAQGAVGRDGLGMLVEQAAESFLDWRGLRPETAAVLAGLRAEVDRLP